MFITFQVASTPGWLGVSALDTIIWSSGNPSLFLSVSWLSGIPSPSPSALALGSCGNWSLWSGIPSLSESKSKRSSIPSPSVSWQNSGSSGNSSSVSGQLSLSSLGSIQSGIKSLSKSSGVLVLSKGSVRQSISSWSRYWSLSSSVSALSPIPSRSLSAHSWLSKGKRSSVSRYPSLSSSGSRQSGSPSLSLSMGLSPLSLGLVPQAISIVSDQLSLSSSVSALFPIPSPSESAFSEASLGKSSQTSPYPVSYTHLTLPTIVSV